MSFYSLRLVSNVEKHIVQKIERKTANDRLILKYDIQKKVRILCILCQYYDAPAIIIAHFHNRKHGTD